MATRRPKVPRASRPAEAAEPSSNTKAEPAVQNDQREFSKASAKTSKPSAARAAGNAAKAKLANANSTVRSATRTVKGAGQTKPVGAAKTATAPVPARSFSGRLIALLVVFVLVVVLVAPTVNNFLQQRANIASLKADIAAAQQQQKDLQNQISRWNDPAYVKQQARDRVNMMMPGETGYWVYGGSPTPATPQQAGTSGNPDSLPWVDGLWQSIVRSATE